MLFFKSKKAFDKAVQAEADRREAERKAQHQKFWDELEAENKAAADLQTWQAKISRAQAAYNAGEYNKALFLADQYISEDKADIGIWAFALLADIQNALGGVDGALGAYNRAEEYYAIHTSEHSERYLDEIRIMREDFIKHIEYLEEMKKRYNFDITPDLERALSRLEGIKVDTLRKKDFQSQDSFMKVWQSVLDEVVLFEQGADENKLNKTTYKGAKNWLKSFSFLCDGSIPDEYRKLE